VTYASKTNVSPEKSKAETLDDLLTPAAAHLLGPLPVLGETNRWLWSTFEGHSYVFAAWLLLCTSAWWALVGWLLVSLERLLRKGTDAGVVGAG
jgi:hypothetical protein